MEAEADQEAEVEAAEEVVMVTGQAEVEEEEAAAAAAAITGRTIARWEWCSVLDCEFFALQDYTSSSPLSTAFLRHVDRCSSSRPIVLDDPSRLVDMFVNRQSPAWRLIRLSLDLAF